MAWITSMYCHSCNQEKQITLASGETYPSKCHECRREEADKKEREWKAGREGLTIEERLRDLENFYYHHGSHYKPIRF